MSFNLLGNVQKLTIRSYTDFARGGFKGNFEVMFNPASITTQCVNKFSRQQGINTLGREGKYAYSLPRELKVDLIIDTTVKTGIISNGKSATEQVKQFMELCYYMDASIHQPNFLKLQWGTGILADFNCLLQSVDIEYTLFDKTGEPLHVVLKTTFIEERIKTDKNSPDLTHTRIIKSGDTLPLLSKEIYGTAIYYLHVAQVNKLNDFRNLIPGQQIIFPPLDSNEAMQ